MKNLRIYETPKTPDIDFNVDTGVLQISGVSIPEDSVEFYAPVINWLKDYVKTGPNNSQLIFKLAYINTSSLQFIYELLSTVDNHIDQGVDFSIEWHYLSEDDDMRELGEDFKSSIHTKISLIEVKAV